MYSAEAHNFEPLGKDKALIGALCNVIIPSLFVIKNLILLVLFTISFTLLDSCTVKIQHNWMKKEAILDSCGHYIIILKHVVLFFFPFLMSLFPILPTTTTRNQTLLQEKKK